MIQVNGQIVYLLTDVLFTTNRNKTTKKDNVSTECIQEESLKCMGKSALLRP